MKNNSNVTVREPLFHVSKRKEIALVWKIVIYASAIIGALLVASIICTIVSEDGNPLWFFVSLFNGNIGTERRIWQFFKEFALLLLVTQAVVPAFKMKFWNLGANGQILIGCLACTAVMFTLGGSVPNALLYALMFIASVLAGVVWAVIPAVFRAFFKTNETLFTLMLNYIASGLVVVMISVWVSTGSGVLEPMEQYSFPDVFGSEYIFTILIAALVTVFMFFYMKKSKHGFELSIVGESENTARYVGLNIRWVIIRTLIVSGAICGIVGFLLSGDINNTVNNEMANNMGFTAIMTAWLGKFDPIIMIGTCALITFVTNGMNEVRSSFGFYNNSVVNFVLGFIYFFIIGCEFFIRYKINLRKKKSAEFTVLNDKSIELEEKNKAQISKEEDK
ncbi:MAG: ABC transporter permease [Clostridia bacterium]|nr:ABC transporter permease [Clostridia bacterium]